LKENPITGQWGANKRMAGAASGNRTRALSLEGRCATTTLWPLTPAASKPFSFSGGAPTGRGMSYCLEGRRSPLKTGLIVNPLDSRNRGEIGVDLRVCGRQRAGLPLSQPFGHLVRRAEPLVGPRRLLRIIGRRVPPHYHQRTVPQQVLHVQLSYRFGGDGSAELRRASLREPRPGGQQPSAPRSARAFQRGQLQL
jgi:hypothetical protein